MKYEKYEKLKEKTSHGDYKLPMKIYFSHIKDANDLYLHWHDEMEIICILSGEGQVYADMQFYPIKEKDLIFIPKGSLHYIVNDKDAEIQLQAMVFDLSIVKDQSLDFGQRTYISPIFYDTLRFFPIIHQEDSGYEEIFQLCSRILKSFHGGKLAYQIEIKGLFLLLFFTMYKYNYVVPTEVHNAHGHNRIDSLKEVLDYIHANYKKPLSVKILSEIAGYSNFHFSRFFKSQSNMTCVEFINLVRIEKAVELLLHTELPVATIAYEVGFADESYFIKIFKRHFNETPSKYRKCERSTFVMPTLVAKQKNPSESEEK